MSRNKKKIRPAVRVSAEADDVVGVWDMLEGVHPVCVKMEGVNGGLRLLCLAWLPCCTCCGPAVAQLLLPESLTARNAPSPTRRRRRASLDVH